MALIDEKKVVISDSTAFGISHHDHNKHTVTVIGLSYGEAKALKWLIENNYLNG